MRPVRNCDFRVRRTSWEVFAGAQVRLVLIPGLALDLADVRRIANSVAVKNSDGPEDHLPGSAQNIKFDRY